MAENMYIITDEIICAAIAENEGMTVRDRVNWIENYITQKVEPWDREAYADLVLQRIDKIRRVKVD